MSQPHESAIFQVTRVTIVTSGVPTTDLAVHTTTLLRRRAEMIAVTIGDLLVYAYSPAAVDAFATAFTTAEHTRPAGLPDLIGDPAANRHDVAVVLRVDGAPRHHTLGLGGQANPTGRPHLQVTVGALQVLAFDQASIRTWATTWRHAMDLAWRLWPVGSRNHDIEVRRSRRIALARAAGLDPTTIPLDATTTDPNPITDTDTDTDTDDLGTRARGRATRARGTRRAAPGGRATWATQEAAEEPGT